MIHIWITHGQKSEIPRCISPHNSGCHKTTVGILGSSESEVVKNIVLIYLTERNILKTSRKEMENKTIRKSVSKPKVKNEALENFVSKNISTARKLIIILIKGVKTESISIIVMPIFVGTFSFFRSITPTACPPTAAIGVK